MSQFSVLTSLISNRLEEACESLNDLRRSVIPSYQQKVTALSDVHGRLCDASELLQSFGFLLTAILILSFLGLTAIAFFFYNHQVLSKMLDFSYMLSRDPKNNSPMSKTKEFNHLLYKLIITDKRSELMWNVREVIATPLDEQGSDSDCLWPLQSGFHFGSFDGGSNFNLPGHVDSVWPTRIVRPRLTKYS
ncbi:unnamed protein product [Nezara viridula]|uniref:Uncharacterized protein n=1 Tax=Nezara viridula TaxID=85310 RepID=A0A9P0H8S5_NEZVI|nr:unnamed protein product [Nezara viridula]